MVELTFSRILRRSAAALKKQHSAVRGMSLSKSYTNVMQRWQLDNSKSASDKCMRAFDEGATHTPPAATRKPKSTEATEATALCKPESKTLQQACVDEFRHHITHIINNGEDIDALEGGITRLLPNVEVLYLFDNRLSQIADLGQWARLRSVYLQNNLIHSLRLVFNNLPFLEELNLDNNRIGKLEGLLGCTRLTRLSIANQQTSTPLIFDAASLWAVSRSLCILNISHNRIEDLRPLATLENLESLEAGDNNVQKLGSVGLVLGSCRHLKSLDLRNNPMQRTPKMRQYIRYVLLHASSELHDLDGKRVTHVQRAFVQDMHRHQQALEAGASGDMAVAVE